MVTYCHVYGCESNSKWMPHLSFFAVPKDENRKKIWAKVMDRNDILLSKTNTKYFVCSLHFSMDMLKNKRLKSYATPVLHLPKTESASSSSKNNIDIKEDETGIIETKVEPRNTETETQADLFQTRQTQTNDNVSSIRCQCLGYEKTKRPDAASKAIDTASQEQNSALPTITSVHSLNNNKHAIKESTINLTELTPGEKKLVQILQEHKKEIEKLKRELSIIKRKLFTDKKRKLEDNFEEIQNKRKKHGNLLRNICNPIPSTSESNLETEEKGVCNINKKDSINMESGKKKNKKLDTKCVLNPTERVKARLRKLRYLAKLTEEQKALKREKDREYYRKRVETAKRKSIDEMSERERNKQRELWRETSKKYRQRRKKSKKGEKDEDKTTEKEKEPETCGVGAKDVVNEMNEENNSLLSERAANITKKETKDRRLESPREPEGEKEFEVEIEVKKETIDDDPLSFNNIPVKSEPIDDEEREGIDEEGQSDKFAEIPIKNEFDESVMVEDNGVATIEFKQEMA